MEIRIVIDRAQALWAAQKAIVNEFPEKSKGRKPPASILHAVWQGILNSPAYGIQGMNVIYLQSSIPEDYLPMILDHEELHLLYYKIIKEDTGDSWKASKATKHIDDPFLNKWLCDLFEISYPDLLSYLRSYIFQNLPFVRTILALKRLIKRKVLK